MKSILRTMILAVACLLFLTGCPYIATSQMIRTVGLGEEATPLNTRTLALESSINTLKASDYITKFKPDGDDAIYYFKSGKSNEENVYGSFNIRLGMGNHTEVKLGVLSGGISQRYVNTEAQALNGEVITFSDTSSTKIFGFQYGIKRLLTDYSEPYKISLFLEGQHFNTISRAATNIYDGKVNQFRTAMLLAYVFPENPNVVPNLSFYYSLAHSERASTFADIPLEKNIQSAGSELNLNLNYLVFYFNIYGGMEREFGPHTSNSLITYLGSRAGLRFDYSHTKD